MAVLAALAALAVCLATTVVSHYCGQPLLCPAIIVASHYCVQALLWSATIVVSHYCGKIIAPDADF